MHTLKLIRPRDDGRWIVGSSKGAAFCFSGLKPEHLVIEYKQDKFVAINLTQDPFVSLNQLPFSRRALQGGDLVEVGGIVFNILIEEKQQEFLTQRHKDTKKEEELLMQEKNKEASLCLCAFVLKKLRTSSDVHATLTLKVKEETQPTPPKTQKTKRFSFFYLFPLCVVLICAALLVHMNALIKTEDPTIAAKAFADTGMALLYASLTNQEENPLPIQKVLSPRFQSYEGASSYVLEKHLFNDSTDFVLIAQPRSSFYPPFLLKMLPAYTEPQAALILDSREMVLRKSSSLKPLRAFLEKQPTLNQQNAAELSQLIEAISVKVPLSLLAKTDNDFYPLNLLGAERLYNLPRYYPFSVHLNAHFPQQLAQLPDASLFSVRGLNDLEKSTQNLQKVAIDFAPYERAVFKAQVKKD